MVSEYSPKRYNFFIFNNVLGAIAYNYTRWSERIYDPILFTGLNCTGNEDNIIKCSVDFTAPVCSRFQGGGNVICPGMLCK